MHYYKRNLGDYAKKAGRLTMLQHGAYTLLIDSCYDREVFPTLEQAIEWTWASTEAEIEAVKFVLSRFFTLDDEGCYVQDRILQELLEYHAKSDKNKRIAIDRETKRRENSTIRAQVVNETPPNQEPLTINQEPLTNKNLSSLESKIPPCPHDEIISLYHQILPELPQVVSWNKTRQSSLKQRWRELFADFGCKSQEEGLEWFANEFFPHIKSSKFLTGKVQSKDRRPFLANLEWVLKPTNFAKIIEGNYQ
jgi:uncharacterized protein YdaU (DUF1376 family)